MAITARDIVLSLIGSSTQKQPEIGRTSLQKVAYFASLATGVNLGHRAFYYGPFSSMVEEETEALVLSGLIEQSMTELGFVNRKGFPGVRYSYSLTEEGSKRLESLKNIEPEISERLEEIVDQLFDTIGSLDQRWLSLAAKTYFITAEQNKVLSVEEIQDLAKQKKWELTKNEVERVAHSLERLGLLQVSE